MEDEVRDTAKGLGCMDPALSCNLILRPGARVNHHYHHFCPFTTAIEHNSLCLSNTRAHPSLRVLASPCPSLGFEAFIQRPRTIGESRVAPGKHITPSFLENTGRPRLLLRENSARAISIYSAIFYDGSSQTFACSIGNRSHNSSSSKQLQPAVHLN